MTATVWFLTGSQDLYGEETLAQVAEQSQAICKRLEAAGLPFDLEWKPVLLDATSIRRRLAEANTDPGCLGVIVWMHTFSPAKMWLTGLDLLRKPMLHLHTQANRALPWSSIDMDFMNLNQAAHGDREFAFAAARVGLARKIVVGHAEEPSVVAGIAAWGRAAASAACLRDLRVARFGDNMRDVAVTEGDKVEAELRFGVSVNTYGVNDLVERVDAVAPGAVDTLVEECLATYDLAPELAPHGERHESLRYALQVEVALREFLVDGGFGAFTTNFQDLGGLRQLPGLAVQRLMADGYGFGGEGDWKTAMLLAAVKAGGAAGGSVGGSVGGAGGGVGGSSFMEDYTYHFGPGTPRVLGAHMLEVCPSIADGRPRVEIHPLSIGDREDPVRLVFRARPGAATVIGLCDLGDRFRLVSNEIDVVPPDEELPRLPVACAVWTPRPDLATAAAGWLTAGGPHHTVLTQALGRESLRDLATVLGVELVRIDADTTVESLVDHLRWNHAYYRLAAGVPRVG